MSDDPTAGADDIDKLIGQMERVAKLDAEGNYRIMDNHLMHSDRVIANVAALKTINDDDLIKEALKNPT